MHLFKQSKVRDEVNRVMDKTSDNYIGIHYTICSTFPGF